MEEISYSPLCADARAEARGKMQRGRGGDTSPCAMEFGSIGWGGGGERGWHERRKCKERGEGGREGVGEKSKKKLEEMATVTVERKNFHLPTHSQARGSGRGRPVITYIFNLKYYHIKLILMLILCNYDACYRSFMNSLHWHVILLKSTFWHYLGLIMCFVDVCDLLQGQKNWKLTILIDFILTLVDD